MTQGFSILPVLAITLFSLFLRFSIGLGSYSGMGIEPKFGDFEAQRHFMEIALNLPISEWYRFDLEYWGLDYPPLTAYHSFLLGFISRLYEPESMILDESRGYETYSHKQFMRWSVVVSYFLVYFSAALYFYQILFSSSIFSENARKRLYWRERVLLGLLCAPSLVIIDHGHFQYNCVMLGFVLWGINLVLEERYFFGAVMFCLGLAYKQMSLYYSLAFFFFLLGIVFKKSRQSILSALSLLSLSQLAAAVIGTFGVLFLPFYIAGGTESLLQIFQRIFPFQRGLYEDKVANFWMAISILVKVRDILPTQSVVRLSAALTLVACLPSCIMTLFQPSKRNFLHSLAIVSLAFFLFSYHVHEKTILLPLLPLTLLSPEYPYLFDLFSNCSLFSMFDLLKRDGHSVTYIVLLIVWNMTLGWNSITSPGTRSKKLLSMIVYFAMATIHALDVLVEPPQKLPHLFVLANVLLSACVFMGTFVYLTISQLKTFRSDAVTTPAETSTRKQKRN